MPLSVRAALTPPICADGAAPKENRAGDIPPAWEENTTQAALVLVGTSPWPTSCMVLLMRLPWEAGVQFPNYHKQLDLSPPL